jgi:hypothetical protein
VDKPDTNAILADLEQSAARLHEWHDHTAAGTKDLTEGQVQHLVKDVRALLDNWAYLRHVLTETGAPLPDEWAHAQQLAGPLGDLCEDAYTLLSGPVPVTDPAWRDACTRWQQRWMTALAGEDPGEDPRSGSADIQLRYLQQAAEAVDGVVSGITVPEDQADGWMGELHAKAAHLVGCVASVDAMAHAGELPAAWLRPWLRQRTVSSPSEIALPASIDEFLDHPETGSRRARTVQLDIRPPGFWGRIELPGMRSYTGWIEEAERFGTRGAVVRDWDGRETHFVVPGPNSPVHRLPTPVRRPGSDFDGDDPSGEMWDGGYRSQDPY